MAQNTSEDKEIADVGSHEITKPSESVELTPVGAIDDFLKPYFNRRDQLQKPSTGADESDYFRFLGERGKIYEEALETARLLKDTRSEAEREDNFGKMEGTLVGAVKKDFETYPEGQPQCGRMECWAARLGLVNIVVALVRSERADDPESPTRMSKGLLALAIAAENNNFTMVDALKDIAVADKSFMKSNEPDLFSPDKKKLNLFYKNCDETVYALYPSHEFWLCPIEAAARLGYVGMVTKLIELGEANMEATQEKMKATQEKLKKELSEMLMAKYGEARTKKIVEQQYGEAWMKPILSEKMMLEKRKLRRAFYWAVRMGHPDVVKTFINKRCIVDLNEESSALGLLGNADIKSYGLRHTPLALAVLTAKMEIVQLLCEAEEGGLRTDAKNGKGKSAIQMAFKKSRNQSLASHSSHGRIRYDIWNYIMKRDDSQTEVSKLTEERKVHVDAINAILVGTALIATATFAGWLSPPLGYSSPPGTDGPFASVGGHPILESFWVFNSLSFFFSIATFMVGANVALPPKEHDYIGDVVQSLRWKLKLAYGLVSAAVFFVIGAFASAGFAVLPPIPKYTVNMALTVGIGVTVVAVVVFVTFFGYMFTTDWEELEYIMKVLWQEFKHKMTEVLGMATVHGLTLLFQNPLKKTKTNKKQNHRKFLS